jgi:pilus assembly protein CpaE
VLDPGTRTAVETVLGDRRLAKTRPTFFDGSIGNATQQYEANQSPDLLLIETHDVPDQIFAHLEKLAPVCRAETNLILVGAHNDVGLYRALIKAGVREYLPLPLDQHHLLDSIISVVADPQELKLGRLISFIGASGGAGSTTIANNTAWCLGKLFDGEVTLVDLDLTFGSIGIDFNLDSPENAAQALAQADRLDDQVLGRILGKYNDNLNLLTAPGDCMRPGDVDAATAEEMLKRFRQNAAWVVADLPHYWGAWVRHVLDQSDEIVVTAVPSLTSLRNAKSIADTLNAKRKNDAPVRVVLNHVGQNAKTEITVKDFANALGSALTVTVPHEASIFSEAANTGHMVGEAPKANRVIEPLNTLATLVSGRQGQEKKGAAAKKPGLLDKLLPGAAGKMLARAKA